jgi:outer membrane protein OmpA-like peptidoglycan-associated protein
VIGQSDGEQGRRFAAPTKSAGADMPAAPSPPADETPTARATISPVHAQAPSAPVTAVSAGMTLADCQTALAASSTPSVLVFRKGSAQLTPSATRALEKAATIIRRCPENATIEVRGHVRGSGAKAPNDALAQRRAEAATGYIEGQGVGGRRLVASPGEADQAENRALTFEVR